MNSQKIEHLVEKYFSGETSLDEERRLKEFFRQKDIPPHLQSLKEQFVFFADEGEHAPLDDAFDERLFQSIKDDDRRKVRGIRRNYVMYFGGIAASILIIIGLFFKFNTVQINTPMNNPDEAYTEARNALLFISETMNKGMKPVSNVKTLGEGYDQMNKLAKYNDGVKAMNNFSRFNESTEIISIKN